MVTESREDLLQKIEHLESRLAESEQLIDAIKAGEVDAFAFNTNEVAEVYTLQSGDYAYRLLIEEFGEGAVNLSEDGLIVYTNNYFADLLQLTYEKVIGRFIAEFVHPESNDLFQELFRKAVTGRSKGEINLLVGGHTIPVYVSMTSLRPNLATVGMIITDHTEKKKHEELVLGYQKDLETKNTALIQSNQELDSFSYIASHDLQEPLRKIQTFCQRIMDTAAGEFSETTSDYFQRIVNASKRMQTMISSLLNYSRMNSADIEKKQTDLNDILREVIAEQVEGDVSKSDVQIIAEPLPVVNCVPDQIRQLFANLISNAIKYRNTKIPPEIRIGCKRTDGYWQITVSDNGIGFEPKYAEKIFELFQRLHTRFEYEGTGIGLAICKKIVQNHHGFMKATGVPGQGASFDILLPADPHA